MSSTGVASPSAAPWIEIRERKRTLASKLLDQPQNAHNADRNPADADRNPADADRNPADADRNPADVDHIATRLDQLPVRPFARVIDDKGAGAGDRGVEFD